MGITKKCTIKLVCLMLLLTALLAVPLAGCGGSSNIEPFLGTWKVTTYSGMPGGGDIPTDNILTVNDDKSWSLSFVTDGSPGDEIFGTWKLEDDKTLRCDAESIEGWGPRTFTLMEDETKLMSDTYTPAGVFLVYYKQ